MICLVNLGVMKVTKVMEVIKLMEVTKVMEVIKLMEVTKVMEVIKLTETNNGIIIEKVKTISIDFDTD